MRYGNMTSEARLEYESRNPGIYGLTSRFYIDNIIPLTLLPAEPGFSTYMEDDFLVCDILKGTGKNGLYLVRLALGSYPTYGKEIFKRVDGEIDMETSYNDLYLSSFGRDKENVKNNFEEMKDRMKVLEVLDRDYILTEYISKSSLEKYMKLLEKLRT
jgi:hypothetical protein